MHSSSLSKPESHVHVCYAVAANEALPSSEFLFIYCVVFLLSHFFCFSLMNVLLKSKFSFQSLCYLKHNDSVTKSDTLVLPYFCNFHKTVATLPT